MEDQILDSRGLPVPLIPESDIESPLKDRDRMTSRLMYYHEHQGYKPVLAEFVCSDFLETYELEPESKRLNKIPPEWKALYTGDIPQESVGLVIVQNLAGANLLKKPTDEEKARYAKQILRVRKAGCENGLEIVIKAGRHEPIHAPGTPLEIKCDFEEGRGYLWVFPR